MTKLTITAAVRTFTQRGVNGVRKTLSTIYIKTSAGELLAERTIPAKWDSASALREFKRFPSRFTPCGKNTPAMLEALAVAA